MALPKKKKCRFCGKRFRPDPRVGSRQRACSAVDCQKKRRKKTQANWRARNPDYRIGYQLKKRAAQVKAGAKSAAMVELIRLPDPPAPLPVPAALKSIPWEFAQSEIGVVGTDLLAVLGVSLFGALRKDQSIENGLCSSTLTDQNRAPA